ncbi:MAG: hypothetical protein WCX83_03135 [Candidatus Cloacimonas sp.]|jgi:hypothetical protein|nr:hypothetical protein [Candidatus Cloacimonadota bacterium]
MNLGQTLLALLALALLVTISLSINKARFASTERTIELQVELEAINYGQSVMEIISNRANTEEGYNSLEDKFNNWTGNQKVSDGSGQTLYSKVIVESEADNTPLHEVPYKFVRVTVYADPAYEKQLVEYKSAFNRWW